MRDAIDGQMTYLELAVMSGGDGANSTCWDGGRFTTGSLFASGEYAARSDQAHLVMSLTLCASTIAYGLFFLGVQGWPVPCFRRRCVERVALAYVVSGGSTLIAGVYLLLRVVWICEGACLLFVARDLVQQQHLAIAALLFCCGALETAHAAAIHTDRLLICRRSVSGGPAPPTRAERLLRPLRNGWVHELWCADLVTTRCNPPTT